MNSLKIYGFLQNAEKAATLVHLCGAGARHEQWRLDSSEIYTPAHARYLGPQLHRKGDTSIEAEIRVKNAWAAFFAHRNVWRCRRHRDEIFAGHAKVISYRFAMKIFNAVVVSHLVSGLASMVLSTAYNTINC